MEYIKITNTDQQLTPNFNMKEFWDCKFSRHNNFEIPKCLVTAQQILRDFYNCGVLITSCSRPDDTFGFHRYLNGTGAIDSIPLINTIDNINKFKQECLNYQDGVGSKLIEDLRTVGVQGFGIESGNCIHLDYRCGEICPDKDKYGVYIVFSWAKVTGSVVYNRK